MRTAFNIKSSRPPRIVGSGLIALDVGVAGNDIASYRALGGSAGNVLAILAYLGWESVPVGKLGQDAAASYIQQEFHALGAETDFLLSDPQAKTPVVFQWNEATGGAPSYSFICPCCGQKRGFKDFDDQSLVDSVKSAIKEPAVFFFDRATATTAALAEHFRRYRGLVCFEPSIVQASSEFDRCVKASHVLKYSADRIDASEIAAQSSVVVEIQTLGRDGLAYRVARHSASWTQLPAIDAPYVADSSGAGDWCTAGALYWFLLNNHQRKGARVDAVVVGDALRFGQALSTLNCMHLGARGVSQSWEAGLVIDTARKIVDCGDLPGEMIAEFSASPFPGKHRKTGGTARDLCCESLVVEPLC